jgi:hypothetical protein
LFAANHLDISPGKAGARLTKLKKFLGTIRKRNFSFSNKTSKIMNNQTVGHQMVKGRSPNRTPLVSATHPPEAPVLRPDPGTRRPRPVSQTTLPIFTPAYQTDFTSQTALVAYSDGVFRRPGMVQDIYGVFH